MKMLSLFAVCGLAIPTALSPADPAKAQAARFIAVSGKDSNPCTFAKPCRNLQRGVNATPAKGELKILGSGTYGVARVGKSITITADHVAASVKSITVTEASATVVLRGILVSGGGVVLTGIRIEAAAAVHIEGCEIERFAQDGILLNDAAKEVFVSHTVSRDNGRNGLRVDGSGATSKLKIDHSRFDNNGDDGLRVIGELTMTHSVVSGNGSDGVAQNGAADIDIAWTTAAGNEANGYNLSSGNMSLESAVAARNGFAGVRVGRNAVVRISNSLIANNSTGIENDGTLLTRQNNTVSGNADDLAGDPLTPLAGI